MKFITVLICLLCTTGTLAAESPLCSEWKNLIEEDHRVLEKDLTQESAERALAVLSKKPPKPKDGYEQLATLNAAKIVKGYGLKREALAADGVDAKKRFCNWLVSEGFWYD